MGQTQCLLGIQCNDFVMIAADQSNNTSIMVMKDDEEKISTLSNNLIMGVIGEAGDTTQFAEYIAKNIQLYKMRNGYELGPSAASHFIRKNLADGIRSRSPYGVNILLGGFDASTGPELYLMDYLGSSTRAPFAAHGIAGMLCVSVLDRYHKPDLSIEEAYEVMKLCVKEVNVRFTFNLPNFEVSIVSKDGIKKMPKIVASSLRTIEDQ